jgi:hypothetical protein
LSLEAAILDGNSVLDIILLRTADNEPSADHVLLDVISVIESIFEFYSSTAGPAIKRVARDSIYIRSFVGDRYSSQVSARLPSSDSSVQNSPEYIEPCPAIAALLGVYCNCHLLNLLWLTLSISAPSSLHAFAP